MIINETEAISFYHALQRFGIRPGLERIRALCALLGDPQNKLKFIHVAGTNGKGSTCTELACVLTAAGYKTGLFTSPYVLCFRERIQINGAMINAADLVRITETVRQAVEKLNRQGVYPTEFEAITAAAFLFFLEQSCDIVVLEVGLGGRFDATNLIASPLVSVITSISMDHMAVLGSTLGEIAAEKCGIIKSGCPVVTSALQKTDALVTIIRAAESNHSQLVLADPRTMLHVERASVFGTDVSYCDQRITIPFAGEHQLENTALVLDTCMLLRENGYSLSDTAIKNGIEAAFIPARTEVLNKDPLVLLDGSHNEGSTNALSALLKSYLSDENLICVMGFMADKDIDSALRHLLPYMKKVIAVTPSNPRAISAEELCDKIRSYGVAAESCGDPILGIDKAWNDLYHNYSALVVCGSLYLASDVRDYMIHKIQK